ncbi:hypothetical protein RJ640_019081 [Escallonia rubra]|uniref:Glutaredoxin domain-containing protein n=1 Tax=Escallonia rubra TaxID=112253 RepID=A0AA88SI79_9ASTE|nr:hypothetical protein RJ640_019081 [Escallonia rubra]
MGCASSKRVEAAVDVYRPAPSSFSVFDIHTIQEPWRTADDDAHEENEEKASPHVPSPILEKLNALEGAPRTWDEVSKELEDLKPTLNSPAPPARSPTPPPTPPAHESPAATPLRKVKRKSFSFHTLEELDTKLTSNKSTKPKPTELRKTESMNELNKLHTVKLTRPDPFKSGSARVESEGYKPLKENLFLVRDRLEREREGKGSGFAKFDPLSDYPEKCPPGGSDKLVLYSTSLGGVRRTYEDCNKVRSILELHGFVFDERDVSLHGEFLAELKELVGEGASVPRMFLKGRYIGGVEEVVGLNETGRLRRLMSRAGVERVVGRQACEGCGGASRLKSVFVAFPEAMNNQCFTYLDEQADYE